MGTICHLGLHSLIMQNSFASIDFEPLFEGLKNQVVDEVYLNILRNLYIEAISVLRLHKDSEKFKLEDGLDREVTYLPNC